MNINLNRAIEAAHAVIELDPPWQALLQSAADLVGADSASLIILDGESRFLSINAVGISDATAKDYSEHYCSLDVVAQQALRSGVGNWVDTNSIMSSRDLGRTEYYTDFLRKHSMAQSLALPLIESSSLRAGLGFQRSSILEDAVEKLTMGPVATFVTTLQTAIQDRQHRASMQFSALDETLAGFHEAISLISATGIILRASSTASHLLGCGVGASIERSSLSRRDRQFPGRLRAAISTANEGKTVRLAISPDWGLVINIHVSPAPRHWRMFNEPSAMVRLHQCDMSAAGDAATLASTFKLTGAESRVLAALAQGYTPVEYAVVTGVSEHTVRTQIGALKRKMNCSRQVELVKLALLVST